MNLSRRHLLLAGVALPLSACSSPKPTRPAASHLVALHPVSHPSAPSHAPALRFTHLAPGVEVSSVPSDATHRQVAITLDDGVRSDVVAGYAALAAHTGMRLTMFANGRYDSWRENKSALMPLIESGQIVIGNHTFSHPNITSLNDAELAHEITMNEKHFKNLFGIDLKPFFRPPFGYINHANRHVLSDLGYDHPVIWYGTFGDDQNISTRAIENNMRQWVMPGKLVIGHLNHVGTLNSYTTLHQLITSRKLSTVTLRDIIPVA